MLSYPRAIGLAILPAVIAYVADQALKAQEGSLGLPWHQHYVDRPLWVLPVVLGVGLCVVIYTRSPLISLGYGLMFGGALSNTNDIVKYGFAWNMFPAPGVDLFFNLADVAILSGLSLCLWGMFRIIAEYYQEQQGDAS